MGFSAASLRLQDWKEEGLPDYQALPRLLPQPPKSPALYEQPSVSLSDKTFGPQHFGF